MPGRQLQSSEIDCRREGPRQLAGEDGSSRHGDEFSDIRELLSEGTFDTVTLGETSGVAGDADCATADDCFKPKCRGIQSSICEHPTDAEGRFGVRPRMHYAASRWRGTCVKSINSHLRARTLKRRPRRETAATDGVITSRDAFSENSLPILAHSFSHRRRDSERAYESAG